MTEVVQTPVQKTPVQTPVQTIAAAEARAAIARDRLADTTAQLQARLDPRVIARNATREATAVGLQGVETVRDNPRLVGGAVTVAGLFLARHRIAGLFRRRPKDVSGLQPVMRIDR